MGIVITILITVLLFGLIIFIHELGHFVCAKLSGVKVHEFALGMGPTLLKKVKGETKYALRLFPIGGFVSMEGEDAESNDDRAFCNKPIYKRVLIVVAGAIMNLILGFIILTIVVSMEPKLGSMQIASFREGATSSKAMMVGDTINKIDGLTIYDRTDLQYALAQKQPQAQDDSKDNNLVGYFDITVKRNGKKVLLKNVEISIVQFKDSEGNDMSAIDFVRQQVDKNPINVLKQAGSRTISFARLVWISLGDLVKGKAQLNDMAGPIGVAQEVNRAQSLGAGAILTLIALITINVGVFNLLPIPALDGGRLVFLIIAAIIRKPVPQKYESVIHAVGFILLMALMVFVTFSDVFRLVK